MKVICNRVQDECHAGNGCECAEPHDVIERGGMKCTQWGKCCWLLTDMDDPPMSVRCTKVVDTTSDERVD